MADEPQNPETPAGSSEPGGQQSAAVPATPVAQSGPPETVAPAGAAPNAPAAGAARPAETVAATPAGGAAAKPPVTPPPAAARPAAPRPAVAPKPAAGAPAAEGAGKAAAPKAAAHEPAKPAPPAGPPDPPPPAGTALPPFITTLQTAIPGGVSAVSYYLGDWTIIVPAEQLLAVAMHLRDAPDALFDYCSDVTATDWPPRAERFDVLYMLYSVRHRHRVRIKVKVGELQPLSSVTGVWPAANWLEREVFDMFGLNITGHPDRRRILMPEDWQGFPQRKDYPLEGPGELLMENPLDWLKLRQAREEAEFE
jgi:NADH-quinone oxidoreductase subunit C